VLGLTEDRAQIVLESSGFIVSMDTAEADLPRGSVLEVFPPPDTIIPLPAEVLMIVSTGPALVAMPLVLGLDREEALVLLDSLGLVVSEIEEVFRFGRDQGVVVEQEPASEIELERGAEVRLKVGVSGGSMEQ
jgi:serine/threonine-protein kinase